MSDAAREERAFLRYLHQDDPQTLERELNALDRQAAGDPYADWWSTSTGAKVDHLIGFEARRLTKAHPGPLFSTHKAGLTSVLYAMERSVDEAECDEMLAGIPHMKEFGEAWLATARRLEEAFPNLDFAYGKADAIQAFLNPDDPDTKRDPFRAPAQHASVVAAWQAWKDEVTQEPRRAPAGQRGPDEDLREANNLWRSWLAYTQVLEKRYPAVLEAALLDLCVLRRRAAREGNPFHLVRERRRRKPPVSPEHYLTLTFDEEWINCYNIEDAIYRVAHWFDHLVESGRLPALPALPRLPTVEEASLDPVRAINGLAAKIEKQVYQALGLSREHHYRHDLAVQAYTAKIPRIRTPGLDVPAYVRERAEYEAWRRVGLLEPIQYVVTLQGLAWLKRLGPKILKRLHLTLDMGMMHATYSMAWEVAPFVFAGQARDEAEFRDDMTVLDAYLMKHKYSYVAPAAADQVQRLRASQPLEIGFQVFRGASLAECEAQLSEVSPHAGYWERLAPGEMIRGEAGGEYIVGK